MSATENPEPADPLLAGIRRLQATFDAKIRYDEVRERLVDSMSEELAAHRQGLVHMQLRTILVDLITMYDDLSKSVEAVDCPPETAKALRFYRDSVEQILARNGVEAFTVAGLAVDRAKQKVISVVQTADPAADRQVAERLRPGFSWHEKVLRPEWVSVHAAAQAGSGTHDHDGEAKSPDTTQAFVEEGAPS
jgi:molecular chaperone GrpE (heat shock protein)